MKHSTHHKFLIACISALFLFVFFACEEKKQDTAEKVNSIPEIPSVKPADYFSPHQSGVQTGGVKIVPVKTPKGSFNVWTKSIGNNPKARVLLLNGGPGHTHEYMECFESFFPGAGIEFIYYDQLGCGNSNDPRDTSLWNLARFADEVEQVRQTLQLSKDNFFILGHSWGGILGIEYALRYPGNLKGLIISNMMADAAKYGEYSRNVLAKEMNPAVVDSIRLLERRGEFTHPRYMELLIPHFYSKFICRIPLQQWPEPLVRSFNKLNQSLYVTMQGPSEFGISGKLKMWDRSAELKNISVPTLVVGAKYDTMNPEYLKWMSEQVPQGSYLFCPNGSHMSMYDDQEIYMKGVIDFIRKTAGIN
ncbi:MAG: proline iminopeptidase-family hydrolase [Crocinitomicaceae bacterium]|nr:proline iminopeptidase-family hydrolase [Crocinitomicaceae bacterium]